MAFLKFPFRYQGRVANPRPVAKIKTGRVSQPITDAAHAPQVSVHSGFQEDRSFLGCRKFGLPSPGLITSTSTPIPAEEYSHKII